MLNLAGLEVARGLRGLPRNPSWRPGRHRAAQLECFGAVHGFEVSLAAHRLRRGEPMGQLHGPAARDEAEAPLIHMWPARQARLVWDAKVRATAASACGR